MSGAIILVETAFIPPHGRTFYVVGAITSGAIRIGMTLALPLPQRSLIDCTIRSIESTADPRATCIGIRYRDARERNDLLRMDLRGRALPID